MTSWLWFCAGLVTLALIITQFKAAGGSHPAVPSGHGIYYLSDDRTGLCFAARLHDALAHVDCTPEVLKLAGAR